MATVPFAVDALDLDLELSPSQQRESHRLRGLCILGALLHAWHPSQAPSVWWLVCVRVCLCVLRIVSICVSVHGLRAFAYVCCVAWKVPHAGACALLEPAWRGAHQQCIF